jgi:hypothetical protein
MDRISIRLFVMRIPSAGHSPGPRGSFWLIEDLRTDGTATGCTDNYDFQTYRCGVLLAAPVRNRRIASIRTAALSSIIRTAPAHFPEV